MSHHKLKGQQIP